MSFFNKKEEVLEIKLTPFGKASLAKGKFKPTFYAFYDDDILYDPEYASFTEPQNDTETRILEETPSLKVQPVMSSRENAVTDFSERVRSGELSFRDKLIQQTPDREYSLTSPLNKSEIGNQYAPAWLLSLFSGQAESTEQFYTGSHMNITIPQLNLKKNQTQIYTQKEKPGFTSVNSTTEGRPTATNNVVDEFVDNFDVNEMIYSPFASENTLIVTNGYILLQLDEKNVEFEQENFEIEVFLVENVNGAGQFVTPGASVNFQSTEEKLLPLSFIPEFNNISESGILLDDDELDQEDPETILANLTPEYVEYFLDFKVDREIEEDILCSHIGKSGKKNLFADLRIDCKKQKKDSSADIYERILDDTPSGDDC